MNLGIATLLGISLNGSKVGRRGVGRVFGSDIPTSEATTLFGKTIYCLGRAAEFTVLLPSMREDKFREDFGISNSPQSMNQRGRNLGQ